MADHNAIRIGKRLGTATVIALAAFGTAAAMSAATAGADEIRPTPRVSSGQAEDIGLIKPDATYGEVRNSDIGEVHAHGDVRESMIAIPGRTKGKKWRHGTPGMPNSFR